MPSRRWAEVISASTVLKDFELQVRASDVNAAENITLSSTRRLLALKSPASTEISNKFRVLLAVLFPKSDIDADLFQQRAPLSQEQ